MKNLEFQNENIEILNRINRNIEELIDINKNILNYLRFLGVIICLNFMILIFK